MNLLGIVLMIIGGTWPLALAVCHPDMTDMRLLLTFWWQYAMAFAVMAGGWIICHSGRSTTSRGPG